MVARAKVRAVNKATQEARDKAAAGGELPLEYMLRVMRDKKSKQPRRDAMAQAAAPYLHSKLTAMTHSTPEGGAMVIEHRHRISSEIKQLMAEDIVPLIAPTDSDD
jgi:hypothetical protein